MDIINKCVCGHTSGLRAYKQDDRWLVGFECTCGRKTKAIKTTYRTYQKAYRKVLKFVFSHNPAAKKAEYLFNAVESINRLVGGK